MSSRGGEGKVYSQVLPVGNWVIWGVPSGPSGQLTRAVRLVCQLVCGREHQRDAAHRHGAGEAGLEKRKSREGCIPPAAATPGSFGMGSMLSPPSKQSHCKSPSLESGRGERARCKTDLVLVCRCQFPQPAAWPFAGLTESFYEQEATAWQVGWSVERLFGGLNPGGCLTLADGRRPGWE
jgi:hypothetical protein